MDTITPFRIDIPQADLDDLQDRLARTRWANELPPQQRTQQQRGPVPPGWEYGVPLDYVQRLVGYWREQFDWRAAEKSLNAEPTTTPTGLASFAFDFRPLRRFAERDHATIVSWHTYDRGSHWATQDAPDLLIEDMRAFFRNFR